MSRVTPDGTAEPVSRDSNLRRERGQGKNHFPCLADHERGWQPYPVDPSSYYMFDNIYVRQRRKGTFRSIVGGVRAGKQGGTGDMNSRYVTTTSVPSFKFPCPAFIVASAPVKSYMCSATNARSIAAELCPLVSWTYYRTWRWTKTGRTPETFPWRI